MTRSFFALAAYAAFLVVAAAEAPHSPFRSAEPSLGDRGFHRVCLDGSACFSALK